MDDVTIRLLQPQDLPLYQAIRLESLMEAPQAFANTHADWAALSEAEWRQRMSGPIMLALQGDSPVGIMGLIRQNGERRAHRASLIMVYLRANLRGTGLADRLLRAVIDHAARSGITQIELTVSAGNSRAAAFYRRHGFRQTGLIPNALIIDGIPVDEITMIRT